MATNVAELLFGNAPEDDEADDYSLTADGEDGDLPELDALEALASPEDESDEYAAGQDDTDGEEVDAEPDERYAQLEAERAQLLQERDRYAQERQLQAVQHAQQAWRQQEAQVIQQASQMPDWERAASHVISFYRNQIQQVTQAAQELIGQAYAGQWLDQVAQQSGLTAEDRALLAGLPPDRVPQIAQALAAKNAQLDSRLARIEDEQKQLRRGRQASRRMLTQADGPSAARGAPPRRQRYQDGSTEQLLAIFNAKKAIAQRGR